MPREVVYTFADAPQEAAFFAQLDAVATLTRQYRDAARQSLDLKQLIPQGTFDTYRVAVINALHTLEGMIGS